MKMRAKDERQRNEARQQIKAGRETMLLAISAASIAASSISRGYSRLKKTG